MKNPVLIAEILPNLVNFRKLTQKCKTSGTKSVRASKDVQKFLYEGKHSKLALF